MNVNRALQGGILIALIGVGGMLYSIRKNMAPAPNPAAAAPLATATQPVAPTPPVATPAEPAGVAAPAAPPVAERYVKPSPLAGSARRTAPRPPVRAAAAAPLAPAAAPAPAPTSAAFDQDYTPAPPARAPDPPPPPPVRTVTIPAGTAIAVRLLDAISSDRNRAGDPFQATLDEPIVVEGVIVADRGATVSGRVAQAQQSGRVAGVAEMALELDRIQTVAGEREIASDTMMKRADTTRGRDAATAGGMAGIGAAIGAIAGGRMGAGIGAAAGGAAGAGTVLATKGKPVKYDPETRLTFRLRAPITVSVDPSRIRSRDYGDDNSRSRLERR